jgi:hypothetical protein
VKDRLLVPYALLGAAGVAAWDMHSTEALMTAGLLVAVLGVATNVDWNTLTAKAAGTSLGGRLRRAPIGCRIGVVVVSCVYESMRS